ncbi:MAG: hypothetical protein KDE19_22510 [Caldilineaceae bacterium]|nr:hypothetical protein [Caldilineaceae bacterium]
MQIRLSVKSKVVLMLVSVSLISALVVGILGWRNSRLALSRTIFANLTALRHNKADQVDAYFRNMRYTIEVLSENDMIVEAMVRFNRAFRQLESSTISPEWDGALEAYYTSQFFPRLFANMPGQADYNLYRPQNQAGLYLQYQYIVANRFEVGEKLLLESAGDGSEYSRAHAYYHPRLRNLLHKFGFYDLFLVNIETGDIVYSVAKETDFASNLDAGPYRRSHLAEALETVRNNTERGAAHLIDFDFYRPSYGTPAAFWTAPVYNGNHLVGVLMVQIATDTLDEIMTNNQQWGQIGLGNTGEIYLVGADFLMRSDARARIEAPEAYQETLNNLGVSQRTAELIGNFETTLLLQEINSPVAEAALQNQEGTEFTTNYLEHAVLASYQPLVIEGLQWAIVAEMDADEAFAPVYTFQRQLLIATVFMIVLLAFLAIGIAYLFMRPVNLLIEGARAVGQRGNGLPHGAKSGSVPGNAPVTGAVTGAMTAAVTGEVAAPPATVVASNGAGAVVDPLLNVHSHDEWGELATTFTEMAKGAHQQAALLAEKEAQIVQLLHKVLPVSAIQRVQQGETQIVDQATQITLCIVNIGGLSGLGDQKQTGVVTTLLQDLLRDIEEAAARYDVEQWLSPEQRLVAVCGLSTPYLDHSRRTVDFALALRAITERLNTRHNTKITVHGGIHSGPVNGSVIRTDTISYELWGEGIALAQHFAHTAGADQLLVSQIICDRLQEQYLFQKSAVAQPAGKQSASSTQTQVSSWVLVGQKQAGGT